MLTPSSLECYCQRGMKNGHITAGWVGECCSELGTPIAIPQSDTKEFFLVGYFRDAATCQWGKIAVMVWARDGSNLRWWGGRMLW